MASREIQDQVKVKLFEEWLPDKPGGLKGLVNMAADAALAVVNKNVSENQINLLERVEFLEGELEAATERAKVVEDAVTPCESLFEGFICEEESNDHDGDHHRGDAIWDDDGNGIVPEPDEEPGSCDCEAKEGELHLEDCPKFVDQTKYLCTQCAVTHQRDSGVGTRHAHLFYGGTPAVSHLEHCPVLEDPEARCNCNAVPGTAIGRAAERRPDEGFR